MSIIYTTQKNVTTAGTAVLLAAAPEWHTGVKIKAKPSNTGLVYFGPAGATSATTGFALAASQEHTFDPTAHIDLNQIGLDAAVSGEGVVVVADA